jgi:hypothetical protein
MCNDIDASYNAVACFGSLSMAFCAGCLGVHCLSICAGAAHAHGSCLSVQGLPMHRGAALQGWQPAQLLDARVV